MNKVKLFIDVAKILGGVVRDTIDVSDYKITILIERKIDDKVGLIVEDISVEKKMSTMDVEIMGRKLRELVGKK
jgi:hypothetical protein